MTAIHRQPHALRPLPPPREPHPTTAPSVEGLVISWEILPDVPSLKAFLPCGSPLTQARLVMLVRDGALHPFLELTHRQTASLTRSPLCGNSPPVTPTFENPLGPNDCCLAHLHAPGVLLAAIAVQRHHAPRVLYARTPLLRTLALPGGAYDRPVAAWNDASMPLHEPE